MVKFWHTVLARITSVLPVYHLTLQDDQTFCAHINRLNQAFVLKVAFDNILYQNTKSLCFQILHGDYDSLASYSLRVSYLYTFAGYHAFVRITAYLNKMVYL